MKTFDMSEEDVQVWNRWKRKWTPDWPTKVYLNNWPL